MRIALTENRLIIESVLRHPEIYPLISEGAPDDFEIPIVNNLFLAGYKQGLVGIACFHPFMDGMKYHPNVLPEQRKYAHEFIRRTLESLIVPIYCEVPERLENLAKYHGFEEISRDEKILMRLT